MVDEISIFLFILGVLMGAIFTGLVLLRTYSNWEKTQRKDLRIIETTLAATRKQIAEIDTLRALRMEEVANWLERRSRSASAPMRMPSQFNGKVIYPKELKDLAQYLRGEDADLPLVYWPENEHAKKEDGEDE